MIQVTKKKATSDSGKLSGGLISASKRAVEVGSESQKVSEGTDSPEAKFDTGPKAKSAAVKADKFPRVGGKDPEELRRGGKAEEVEEEDRSVVTDLRVRLHKKKQEAVQGKKVEKSSRVEQEEEEEELSGRKVLPPGRT